MVSSLSSKDPKSFWTFEESRCKFWYVSYRFIEAEETARNDCSLTRQLLSPNFQEFTHEEHLSTAFETVEDDPSENETRSMSHLFPLMDDRQ